MAQNKSGYTRFENPPHVSGVDQPPAYEAAVPPDAGVPVVISVGPPYPPPNAFGNPAYGPGGGGYPAQPYMTGPYSGGAYEQPLPYGQCCPRGLHAKYNILQITSYPV